jgi:mitogen-activated protein kinase kinase 3
MNDLKLLVQNKVKAEREGSAYCPFLVNLYGGYFDEGSVKIILELMDCGSLCDLIKKAKLARTETPIIEEPILSRIAQQILNGLMYLHIVGHQIHRDIKPANVLINTKGEVKLTDFGISKELDMTNQLASTQLGTISYM